MSSVDDTRAAIWLAMQEDSRKRRDDESPPLQHGDGDGTSDSMEPWQTSVEQRLGQLHADVRHLLFGLIGGSVFLLSAGAAAYLSLADKADRTQTVISDVRVDAAAMNAKLDTLIERTPPVR